MNRDRTWSPDLAPSFNDDQEAHAIRERYLAGASAVFSDLNGMFHHAAAYDDGAWWLWPRVVERHRRAHQYILAQEAFWWRLRAGRTAHELLEALGLPAPAVSR